MNFIKSQRSTVGFLAVAVLFIAVVQVLLSLGILNNFWNTLLRFGAVMAIVSLGLNLIYGFNGQFSLGQWGFYAIGAYAAADVTYRWDQMKSASGLVVLFLVVLLVGLSFWSVAKLLTRLRGIDPLSGFTLYLVGVIVAGFVAVQLVNS
jgi:branched-chain amino acid transport system permease protein